MTNYLRLNELDPLDYDTISEMRHRISDLAKYAREGSTSCCPHSIGNVYIKANFDWVATKVDKIWIGSKTYKPEDVLDDLSNEVTEYLKGYKFRHFFIDSTGYTILFKLDENGNVEHVMADDRFKELFTRVMRHLIPGLGHEVELKRYEHDAPRLPYKFNTVELVLCLKSFKFPTVEPIKQYLMKHFIDTHIDASNKQKAIFQNYLDSLLEEIL